jgi:hypothetical protein
MLNHANIGSTCATTVWFPSMLTHHTWVLLEKFLSCDFWLLENLGCYNLPSNRVHEGTVPQDVGLVLSISLAILLL